MHEKKQAPSDVRAWGVGGRHREKNEEGVFFFVGRGCIRVFDALYTAAALAHVVKVSAQCPPRNSAEAKVRETKCTRKASKSWLTPAQAGSSFYFQMKGGLTIHFFFFISSHGNRAKWGKGRFAFGPLF